MRIGDYKIGLRDTWRLMRSKVTANDTPTSYIIMNQSSIFKLLLPSGRKELKYKLNKLNPNNIIDTAIICRESKQAKDTNMKHYFYSYSINSIQRNNLTIHEVKLYKNTENRNLNQEEQIFKDTQ